MSRRVFGIGINDAGYVVRRKDIVGTTSTGKPIMKDIWACPFYSKWKDMLKRCYSASYQKKQPTYIGCTVCSEWLTFSKFKNWMEIQDWHGKQLDKDILFKGNKHYSSDTCVFVDTKVNLFMSESTARRGENPIGVSFNKAQGKYVAYCNSAGKTTYLGLYVTPEAAHEAWYSFKLRQAYILAAEQKDERVAKALVERYEKYKENK